MFTQYMTHPDNGATHAYDQEEVKRLEKQGWQKAQQPTAEQIRASKKGARADALKAELAALEANDAAPEAPKPEKKKPGRKAKAAA